MPRRILCLLLLAFAGCMEGTKPEKDRLERDPADMPRKPDEPRRKGLALHETRTPLPDGRGS